MSLVGYGYDDDEQDERQHHSPKRKSPKREGLSLVASDYGDHSLSASGGNPGNARYDVDEDDNSFSFLKKDRAAGPTPVDSKDPSPAPWMERTQDFYKSPGSFSPSRSTDHNPDLSPSPSISRGVSLDRDGESERPAKRPRMDYSIWKNDYPPPTVKSSTALLVDIAHEFDYKRAGKNINREIRNNKIFKNPDIIDLLSRRHNILEIAFYDSLEKKQTELYLKDEEAKKLASAKGSRVIDFVAASRVGKK